MKDIKGITGFRFERVPAFTEYVPREPKWPALLTIAHNEKSGLRRVELTTPFKEKLVELMCSSTGLRLTLEMLDIGPCYLVGAETAYARVRGRPNRGLSVDAQTVTFSLPAEMVVEFGLDQQVALDYDDIAWLFAPTY